MIFFVYDPPTKLKLKVDVCRDNAANSVSAWLITVTSNLMKVIIISARRYYKSSRRVEQNKWRMRGLPRGASTPRRIKHRPRFASAAAGVTGATVWEARLARLDKLDVTTDCARPRVATRLLCLCVCIVLTQQRNWQWRRNKQNI